MLANQYFLSRRYKDALQVFEKIIVNEPTNYNVQKKLILCYAESALIDKALDLYYKLIGIDVGLITDTDPVRDDCPCPQLIYDFECAISKHSTNRDMNITLGILWTYCDLERAIFYFRNAANNNPNNKLLKSIYITLSSKSYKPKMEEN